MPDEISVLSWSMLNRLIWSVFFYTSIFFFFDKYLSTSSKVIVSELKENFSKWLSDLNFI